jgi:hypothetical protein
MLEFIGMLTVTQEALQPYRGVNEGTGQITYRICSVMTDGKLYFGQQALAAVEQADQKNVASLITGVDVEEVTDFQVSYLLLGDDEPELMDAVVLNTAYQGTQVYAALRVLPLRSRIKVVFQRSWRIERKGRQAGRKLQQITPVMLQPLYLPEVRGETRRVWNGTAVK